MHFSGGYQLATPGGSVDLRAQTTGTSGVTYSWNTSNLTDATSITGASTFDLKFTWSSSILISAVPSVTLTATNSSSQQEVQTYYFELPTGTGSNASAPTWPTTLSPDTVNPTAPEWSSDGVSVNVDSGALDTMISLPSYNSNVPANALVYDSLTANPMPIIVVPHTLDPTQAVPSEVSAQLTFNGTAGTAYYYSSFAATKDFDIMALSDRIFANSQVHRRERLRRQAWGEDRRDTRLLRSRDHTRSPANGWRRLLFDVAVFPANHAQPAAA